MNTSAKQAAAACLPVVAAFAILVALPCASPGDEKPLPDIVVNGKLFCSLRQYIVFPLQGTVTNVLVRVGQAVEVDDPLAQYQLTPREVSRVRRRMSDQDLRLAEAELAQAEMELSAALALQAEVAQLASQDMAPARQLEQAGRKVTTLSKRQSAARVRAELARLTREDDLALLARQVGVETLVGDVPREATLRSPLKGTVLSIYRDIRPGARVQVDSPGFTVGVMEPMLVRAQLHELDAVQVRLGDKAKVKPAAFPGRVLDGVVTRVSWKTDNLTFVAPSYYEVELTVPNPGLDLKEGFKAEIVFGSRP